MGKVVFVVIDFDIDRVVGVFSSPEKAREVFNGNQYYLQAFELKD